jgi:hypothetical protein
MYVEPTLHEEPSLNNVLGNSGPVKITTIIIIAISKFIP